MNLLLLQGPVGPFFDRLQQTLVSAGHRTWRVCFHAGDRLYSSGEQRIHFHGDLAAWHDWLAAFISSAGVDCIVLFGAERPAHQAARKLAHAAGIPVLALEEGYIRPGWVTAEAAGNNADSPLAGHLPPEDWCDNENTVAIGHRGFFAMCRHGAIYYAARALLTFDIRNSLFHRNLSPLEPIYWLRNAMRWMKGRTRDLLRIHWLLEHHSHNYYLVPLQVEGDSQLQRAALGWSNTRLIAEVLQSFARSALPTQRLVFKIHPLDRGHTQHKRLIEDSAAAMDILDRVDVIEVGSPGLLTSHAAGMVTINSSMGLAAIHHGIPLYVVGKAIYAHPQWAQCGFGVASLDGFWRTPPDPSSAEQRHRYLSWIRSEALLPGDFYAADGIGLACRGILEKLQNMHKTGMATNNLPTPSTPQTSLVGTTRLFHNTGSQHRHLHRAGLPTQQGVSRGQA